MVHRQSRQMGQFPRDPGVRNSETVGEEVQAEVWLTHREESTADVGGCRERLNK